MIPKKVNHYNKAELINWLRNEAGSSNPDYFHAIANGGLKLQQVPEEYAELLLLLKNRNIKHYLELGIGNGGSFAMACFMMQECLELAVAVDNLAYKNLGIGQNEEEIIKFIETVDTDSEKQFMNCSTDAYFLNKIGMYDAIFIDADHSYEGAKRDYANSLKQINKGGIIIFHDINSAACPGIMQLWQEVKQGKRNWEFIASKTCGIGVIEI